jgi:hypothetical protein
MTTIKLKNGSGAPTAGDLAQGEPASTSACTQKTQAVLLLR